MYPVQRICAFLYIEQSAYTFYIGQNEHTLPPSSAPKMSRQKFREPGGGGVFTTPLKIISFVCAFCTTFRHDYTGKKPNLQDY
jgi:hypothetical protein